jgi:hypothetical protein
MNHGTFEKVYGQFSDIIGPDTRHYPDKSFWESVGNCDLDRQLTDLADCFRQCSSCQRQVFRSSVHAHASWNLIAYVRRLALLLLRDSDPIWVRRGLAIANLENGQSDFRDSIVSLVILRAAAESIGLDPVPEFNETIKDCEKSMIGILENARDHHPQDVRCILRTFGPDELKPTRQRNPNAS